MANYLSYWTPQNARHDEGYDFKCAYNSRYDKVKAGDTLWIVTAENSKLYLLAGGMVEEAITQRKAKKHPFFSGKQNWPQESTWQKYWVIIKKPWMKLERRDITDIAWDLRFDSKSNDKMYEDPSKWGNALQTLRTLTPKSAELLQSRLSGLQADSATVVVTVPESKLSSGAGFGDPISNREVEKAAIYFVTSHYTKLGWNVISKEQEKCGYDLHCQNGDQIHHVEVKGIKGGAESVILTKNEVAYLERPESFVCIVSSALSSPKLMSYSGKEFKKQFKLEPYAFMAAKF